MNNPKMNHFHLCVFTIIFTTLFRQAFSVDSSYYEACKPQTCGNGPNISYPFWLSDHQESYCGYPSFKLVCKDKNPVLAISHSDYIIKEIFYSNQTFLVANSAVYEDECPLPLHKFSLDRTPFNYSSKNADFSFFYNCSQKPLDYYVFTYPISCASNSTSHSFASIHKEVLKYMNHTLVDSCESPVDVPVDYFGAAGVHSMLKMSYTDILKMGFLLNWTAQDCSNCERSGGRCGFDNNEVICFCSDRSHEKTCDDGICVATFSLFSGSSNSQKTVVYVLCSITFCL